MKINGTDVGLYGARQHRVVIGHNSLKDSSEWIPFAVLPYFAPQQIGFKQITVTVNIKGTSREEIISKRSGLLSQLVRVVEMELDGFDHLFYVVLTNHRETEIVQWRWHQLELTFQGYEHGELESSTGSGSLTVNNPGNIISPCIIEITPAFGAASIELTGICRDSANGDDLPVTIKDLTTGSQVILDGITGLITEGDALKEVDAWALPSMLPGENTITCSSNQMNITVKVMPMYM